MDNTSLPKSKIAGNYLTAHSQALFQKSIKTSIVVSMHNAKQEIIDLIEKLFCLAC